MHVILGCPRTVKIEYENNKGCQVLATELAK